MPLFGTLTNLPSVARLDLYYTASTTNSVGNSPVSPGVHITAVGPPARISVCLPVLPPPPTAKSESF